MIPRIFVSYIDKDGAYREKINCVIMCLKRQGLTVVTFDDMKLGSRLTDYIEQIKKCNFILCLCTPEYKEKADMDGYRRDVITATVINEADEAKFIPVLLGGDKESSFPNWANPKICIDYRNESEDELMNFTRAVNKYVEAYDYEHQDGEESITIIDKNGMPERKNVVCAFKTIETGAEYIVYTDNKKCGNNCEVVYVSQIKGTQLCGIEDENEWEMVKRIIWRLGNEKY